MTDRQKIQTKQLDVPQLISVPHPFELSQITETLGNVISQ